MQQTTEGRSEVFLNQFQRTMQWESLRYQCGRQMWCPGCDGLLDVDRAVSLDITGEISGKLVFTRAICGKCFDEMVRRGNVVSTLKVGTAALGEECKAEVFDGRLWDETGMAKEGRGQ